MQKSHLEPQLPQQNAISKLPKLSNILASMCKGLQETPGTNCVIALVIDNSWGVNRDWQTQNFLTLQKSDIPLKEWNMETIEKSRIREIQVWWERHLSLICVQGTPLNKTLSESEKQVC